MSSSVNLETENEINCEMLSNVKSAQIYFTWQIMFYDNHSISVICPCKMF